jgi:hypothetical protein
MGDDAVEVQTPYAHGLLTFRWSCPRCGSLVLESTVPDSTSVEALERLEWCDRALVELHRCEGDEDGSPQEAA